ncbi:Lipopolysaccharide export system ATP-binding protein LptB [archaeon HR01]|nr:Lipopolysaccharide export system ATP-binding protein LptB [archaeon HR01]
MLDTAAIEVENVSITFDGVRALDRCTLRVEKGESLGIIGPNGSGKTTLLNVINGYYRPEDGRVMIFGRRIDGLPPHRISRMGVGRVFQVTNVFKNMTVLENIMAQGVWMKERKNLRSRALEIMDLVGLPRNLKDELAGNVSGGQQKLVDIARALLPQPEILMLDEPVAGIHPIIKEKIIEVVDRLRRDGKTLMVVSHDIPSILRMVDRLAFMNAGSILMVGDPDEVRRSSKVVEAYLGV